MNTILPITEMERAYRNRDASYNGLFFVAVRTARFQPLDVEQAVFGPDKKRSMGN